MSNNRLIYESTDPSVPLRRKQSSVQQLHQSLHANSGDRAPRLLPATSHLGLLTSNPTNQSSFPSLHQSASSTPPPHVWEWLTTGHRFRQSIVRASPTLNLARTPPAHPVTITPHSENLRPIRQLRPLSPPMPTNDDVIVLPHPPSTDGLPKVTHRRRTLPAHEQTETDQRGPHVDPRRGDGPSQLRSNAPMGVPSPPQPLSPLFVPSTPQYDPPTSASRLLSDTLPRRHGDVESTTDADRLRSALEHLTTTVKLNHEENIMFMQDAKEEFSYLLKTLHTAVDKLSEIVKRLDRKNRRHGRW